MGFYIDEQQYTEKKKFSNDLYPFSSNYLEINGHSCHYLDEGKGEAIVMVHGNPSWSFYYRDLIKVLRKNYRVIVPDQIGMGLSDKPDDKSYNYTSAQRIDDLGRLVDHLKLKKFTLVGHDWGGIIGTAYASFNPERIKAMVMMNTAGFIWPVSKRLPAALFLSRVPIFSDIFIRGFNAFARGAVWIGMKRRRMSRDVAKGMLYPYQSWNDRISVHRFIQDIPVRPSDPGYDLGLRMESRLKLLRDIPKLICWGLKDFIFDHKMLTEWVRHFPDAEVHSFPDAGHYILEDAAEDVIPVIEKFIKTKVYPTKKSPGKEAEAAPQRVNDFVDISENLLNQCALNPDRNVVVHMKKTRSNGKDVCDTITYSEAEKESNRIAHGLEKAGIRKGMHTVFMVTPGVDFFVVLAALLKVGAIPVLVDPGMGVRNLKKCIDEAEPEAFIGIPRAHMARVLLGWSKKTIKIKISLGLPFFPGGFTLKRIRTLGSPEPYIFTDKHSPRDMAMLAFTSGNTGIPKGVVYTHGLLSAQLNIIKNLTQAWPGDADLATFPPFALFGPACGITAVIPDMDTTRPADADPQKLVSALNVNKCTSTFCSPALIDKIGKYCESNEVELPTLKRILSAGAPARMSSIERFVKYVNPGVEVLTPYGATEALPVSIIGSDELLKETRDLTDLGAGVCVGRTIEGVEAAIIGITEEPIQSWSDKLKLPIMQIGEIVVKGPVVTTEYYKRPVQTNLAKIKDGKDDSIWHRMGDVGYIDEIGRLWMCGRKVHRVETQEGTFYTLPCEAIFNNHPKVHRSALVGVQVDGKTVPLICIETEKRPGLKEKKQLTSELLKLAKSHKHTEQISMILYHRRFPVDIRHNAKILREKLALWAQRRIS